MILNRGRFQAQGEKLEKSVPWSKSLPFYDIDGHACMDDLVTMLNKKQNAIRAKAFDDARSYIDRCSSNGGVRSSDVKKSKSFRVKSTMHERVDIEVNSGTAFEPQLTLNEDSE